jgi:sterol desaturase/sphingolipid hydroxylase (fatty acid hydroxylase superfamily)
MLPFAVPNILLGDRIHFFTYIVIGSQRLIAQCVEHCGYEFPWDPTELLPLRATVSYHDYHHQGNINCNYGAGSVITDWIFGYNRVWYEHLDNIAKKEDDGPSTSEESPKASKYLKQD